MKRHYQVFVGDLRHYLTGTTSNGVSFECAAAIDSFAIRSSTDVGYTITTRWWPGCETAQTLQRVMNLPDGTIRQENFVVDSYQEIKPKWFISFLARLVSVYDE